MSGTVVAAGGVLIDSDVLIWFARGNGDQPWTAFVVRQFQTLFSDWRP